MFDFRIFPATAVEINDSAIQHKAVLTRQVVIPIPAIALSIILVLIGMIWSLKEGVSFSTKTRGHTYLQNHCVRLLTFRIIAR